MVEEMGWVERERENSRYPHWQFTSMPHRFSRKNNCSLADEEINE